MDNENLLNSIYQNIAMVLETIPEIRKITTDCDFKALIISQEEEYQNLSDSVKDTITSNGAQVVDLEEKKTIFRMLMKRERVIQFLKECEGLNVVRMTHIQHRYVMEGPLMEVAGRIVYGRDVDGIRRVNDMEAFVEKIHYDIEEVQVYFFSGRTRRKVAEILEGYPDFSSAFGSKYVEIFAKNTSKGTALNALASRLGIAKEEIACIGDSANDLPMFEAAGLKIAMGNAVQELKKKADIVAYSNHIDGAAKVIEQYIL